MTPEEGANLVDTRSEKLSKTLKYKQILKNYDGHIYKITEGFFKDGFFKEWVL